MHHINKMKNKNNMIFLKEQKKSSKTSIIMLKILRYGIYAGDNAAFGMVRKEDTEFQGQLEQTS